MLRRFSHALMLAVFGCVINLHAQAQTDSTDLTIYMTDVVLLTEMDSMVYGGGDFELLNVEFAISDTVTFDKVHLELFNASTGHLIFRHIYPLSELESESLITDWLVNIPLGNLENTAAYAVSIIIEDYAGALGPTLTKTLLP